MKIAELHVQKREALGRKVKALRREGLVPGNIVSNGKESVSIQVQYNILLKILQTVGYTQPITLKLEDDKYTVLVTDVKHIPARNTLEHVTFQEVKKGEKVTAEVPLVLVGDAPAAHKGLLVLQVLDTLEVEADALNIPEHLDVDISSLEEDGDSVHVADIKLPEGVVAINDPEAGIVKAEAPRVVEEEPEESEGEEATEADSEDSEDTSEPKED